MTDFAVTHLSRAQADVLPRSLYESVGVPGVPIIEMGSVSKGNRVALEHG